MEGLESHQSINTTTEQQYKYPKEVSKTQIPVAETRTSSVSAKESHLTIMVVPQQVANHPKVCLIQDFHPMIGWTFETPRTMVPNKTKWMEMVDTDPIVPTVCIWVTQVHQMVTKHLLSTLVANYKLRRWDKGS